MVGIEFEISLLYLGSKNNTKIATGEDLKRGVEQQKAVSFFAWIHLNGWSYAWSMDINDGLEVLCNWFVHICLWIQLRLGYLER